MRCSTVRFLCIYFEVRSGTLRITPEHQSLRAECIAGVTLSILPCQAGSEGRTQPAVVACTGSWGKPRSGCAGEQEGTRRSKRTEKQNGVAGQATKWRAGFSVGGAVPERWSLHPSVGFGMFGRCPLLLSPGVLAHIRRSSCIAVLPGNCQSSLCSLQLFGCFSMDTSHGLSINIMCGHWFCHQEGKFYVLTSDTRTNKSYLETMC